MQTTTEPNGSGDPFAGERANLEATAPRTLDIVLVEPIEFSNGKTYDHLHLEEPTVAQQLKAEGLIKPSPMTSLEEIRAYQMQLISDVSGVPRGVLERMRISQFDQAADFFGQYGLIGRQIGRI